jgi:hypothetical protein
MAPPSGRHASERFQLDYTGTETIKRDRAVKGERPPALVNHRRDTWRATERWSSLTPD